MDMDAARGRRREALSALSELFLDTEQDDLDIAYVARRLSAVGYSERELNDLFYLDVEPVPSYSIFEAPGRWPAFDIDWLEAEIERRKGSWVWRTWSRLRRTQQFSEDLWLRVMAQWRTM